MLPAQLRLRQIACQWVSTLLLPIVCGVCIPPAFSERLTVQAQSAPLLEYVTQTQSDPAAVTIDNRSSPVVFLVSLNVGRGHTMPAVFVRGLADEVQAVDLASWQVPTSELFSALQISTTVLANGQIALSSPGLVTEIDADVLTVDSELGEVISVGNIESLLGVVVHFDAITYTLVLEPPRLIQQNQSQQSATSNSTEGLPIVTAPRFNLSAVRQQTSLSGGSSGSPETTGTLSAIGSLLGGSWYARTSQPNVVDSRTWRLLELQYLRQTEHTDYVVGTQPTFWPGASGRYWGATTVHRFGFEAEAANGDGFSPSQRRQSRDLRRTLVGEAEPGTLVRLVSKPNDQVLNEVSVDATGRYRFEAVSTAAANASRLLLYPDGKLFVEPEVRRPNFLALPGQLSAGTATAIATIGVRTYQANKFFDRFDQVAGGASYRRGVSDSLTLGVGALYDKSPQGLIEAYYQPTAVPLRLSLSATANSQRLSHDANLFYRPSNRFSVSLDSNEHDQRFDANWQVNPNFKLNASGSTQHKRLQFGASGSVRHDNFFLSGSGSVDMQGDLDWLVNARWHQLQLYHRRLSTETSTILNYSFSPSLSVGHSTFLGYDTQSKRHRSLFQAGWRYRSRQRSPTGADRWRLSLGYGIGSSRSGLIASAQVNLLPGLGLEAHYEEVSLSSDNSAFRIELSPSFGLRPSLMLSDMQPEDLRTEGTLLVQPFFDTNTNGHRDAYETLHTEELDSLLSLDHRSVDQFRSEITSQGMIIRTESGRHRLDLEPTGYLLGWVPSTTAYVVDIVAGAQTVVSIPFVRSYAVSGIVRDSDGKPLEGAIVEATPEQNGRTVISTTNHTGVFSLERLSQHRYHLSVNGKTVHSRQLEINKYSPNFQELDFSISE